MSCTVQGCSKPASSRGWCNTHYERWRLGGDLKADCPVGQAMPRGAANNRFNGGLSRSTDGRRIIVHRDGKRYSYYYRALMKAHLGRALRRGEIVHHINEDPTDDRIENLALVTRADHINLHREQLRAGWVAAHV